MDNLPWHPNPNHTDRVNHTLRELNDEEALQTLPAIIYMAVLMVSGTVGNSLVCYIYSVRQRMTTQHFLFVALAVVDVLNCLISMPTEIVDISLPYEFDNDLACRMMRFFTYFSIFASVFTLLTIAVDRFLKVCRPMDRQISLRAVKMAVLGNLLVSLLCAAPVTALYDVRETKTPQSDLYGYSCGTNTQLIGTPFPYIYNGLLIGIFFSVLILLTVLYCKTWRELKRHDRYMARLSYVRFATPSRREEHSHTEDSPRLDSCQVENGDSVALRLAEQAHSTHCGQPSSSQLHPSVLPQLPEHAVAHHADLPDSAPPPEQAQPAQVLDSAQLPSIAQPCSSVCARTPSAGSVRQSPRRYHSLPVSRAPSEEECMSDKELGRQHSLRRSASVGNVRPCHVICSNRKHSGDVKTDSDVKPCDDSRHSDDIEVNVKPSVHNGGLYHVICSNSEHSCNVAAENDLSLSADNEFRLSLDNDVHYHVTCSNDRHSGDVTADDDVKPSISRHDSDITTVDDGTEECGNCDRQAEENIHTHFGTRVTHALKRVCDSSPKVCNADDVPVESDAEHANLGSSTATTAESSGRRPGLNSGMKGLTWLPGDVSGGGGASPQPCRHWQRAIVSPNRRRTRQATIIPITITVVFFLSFVPHLSLAITRIVIEDFEDNLQGVSLALYNIFLRSVFVNSVCNPIIYGVLNRTFRAECWRVFRTVLTCSRPTQPAEASDTCNSGQTGQ